MVSMHLRSFAMPVVAQIIVTFYYAKVNRLSNTFKKFYGRHTDLVGQYTRKMSVKCLLILSVKMIFIFIFDGFADGQINKIS